MSENKIGMRGEDEEDEEDDYSPPLSGGGEFEDFKLSAVKLADLLKEVTKVVDVTKGTLQLQMIIFLNDKGMQSADQISKELGKRRKAVTDALRKLKLKEVVKETTQSDDKGESAIMYELTDSGKEYVDSLKDIFSNKGSASSPSSITTNRGTGFRLIELIEEIPLLFNTYDAIIAIGLAGSRGLPASKLARLFGLSEQRAITYLDLFTDARGATLFKKKIMNPSNANEDVRYVLSENGLRTLKLLPLYNSLNASISFKILKTITRADHPRQVYSRSAILLAVGSLLSLADRLLPEPFFWPFTLFWIAFVAFIGVTLLMDQAISWFRE
jgi:DNA-binding MarR family transcriptional regulator